ncbi:prolactin-releasing peptide-like [Lethenteron reissneri]|uniref:prolactin-releasing peptide-like n=1 Tax=Lethenteron reissneri TaxID=7753 RepID=UPI002AB6BE99|nr:prolactin-releasing peptide-like [Lethenteron reissneri]
MLLPLLKNGAPFRGLKLLAALGGLCLLQATLGAAAESRPPHPSPLYIRGREVNPLWYVGRGVRPIGRFGKRQMPWVSDAPVRIRQQETAWPDASPARRGLWLLEGATGALMVRRGTPSPGLAASRFGSRLRMKRLG